MKNITHTDHSNKDLHLLGTKKNPQKVPKSQQILDSQSFASVKRFYY